MTARYIAEELGLPMLTVEPAQVLTSLLGESARNLAEVLQAAKQIPSVVFLDELDAYARRRSDASDVAEPKRLVNTLLLELDRWPERSVLIAATNELSVIDEAVLRRFQMQVQFPMPTAAARASIISVALRRADRTLPESLITSVAATTEGRSGSEISEITMSALRRSIIDGLPMDRALISQFFATRFAGRGKSALAARRAIAEHLQTEAGMSPGEIAHLLQG
jgi:SpoVK/Ycf46/Vps4 family AAA+-type ATPase